MLTPQRVREAESRAGTSTSNGPLRARGKGNEYGATGGHRQGPGVCRHSAECTGQTVKQGGSAEVISSLTSNCQGLFAFWAQINRRGGASTRPPKFAEFRILLELRGFRLAAMYFARQNTGRVNAPPLQYQ